MRIAIANVDVVAMDGARTLPSRTVVVKDGRIETIAPSASIAIDRMDRVIDGTDRWLVPALADVHVHFWDPDDATLFIANGIAVVRNMWGAPFHLDWQRRVDAREVAGPRVVTTSPIVDGVGPSGRPFWQGATTLTEARLARDLVEGYAAQGYRQLKAYSLLRPDVLAALGDAARDAGLRLTGHCPSATTFEDAIGAGQSCFEHLTAIENGHLRPDAPPPSGGFVPFRTLAAHLDVDAIRSLARRMAGEDVWNCPTTVVWFGMATPDLRAAFADPRMRYLSQRQLASWDPMNDFRFRAIPDRDAWAAASAVWTERRMECVSILHGEGAPIIAGTDTPNPFVVPGFSLHDELANLVRCGMSPYAAIRCATADAARFLGERSDWGTIERGRRADLLLVSGNPLRDVGALRDIETMLVNGFVLGRAEIEGMLERLAQKHATPAEPPDLGPEPGGVVRRGVVTTRIGGRFESCCSYRHSHTPEGEIQIDEALVGPGLPPRRTSVRLAADGTVERAEIRLRAADGAEGWITMQRTHSGYRAERLWAGDSESQSWDVASDALLPGPSTAVSALPVVLETVADGTHRALGEGGVPIDVEVSSQGAVRRVRIENRTFEVRVTADGFEAVEGTVRGPRVVSSAAGE